ncbi:MAG TPA: hypothetical protein VIE65_15275 [Methylobacter sp.]|jgi:hypothetical protein
MSYDHQDGNVDPPHIDAPRIYPKDLESIVTYIELASIFLTNKPGAEFTVEQLISEIRKIGGDDAPADSDVKIVLPFMKSLERVRGGRIRVQ